MAAIIFYGPGERWAPDVSANRRGERPGSPFNDDVPPYVPSWRSMRFSWWGDRFDQAEIRTEFWLNSRNKALADVFPVDGKWGCSTEWRAAVEELEPGLHQFFPIRIRRPRGGPIFRLDGREAGAEDFFLFNCLSVVDCVVPEHCSGLVAVKREPDGSLYFSARESILAVSRAAVAGRHLWHSRTDGVSGHFFISDELRRRFVERGLKGFVIRPVAEV